MASPSNWISGPKKVDFRHFEFFFRKIMVFQAKTKFFFLLILFVPECPETHSRHNLLLFLPYKPIKTGIQAETCHFCRFSDFWWLSLRAKFRGYIFSEMAFWHLHMKIGCQEHVWVPSVHRKKSSSYPLKIASKIFGFSTKEFLGIFCPDLAVSLNKHPPKWNFGHNGTVGGV